MIKINRFIDLDLYCLKVRQLPPLEKHPNLDLSASRCSVLFQFSWRRITSLQMKVHRLCISSVVTGWLIDALGQGAEVV